MAILRIYTDGACSGNQEKENFGGWGAILEYGEHQKELFGGQANTTNNRMELCAVISGLEILREPCEVTVYSDSKYVVDAMKLGWARGWKEKGWKKSDGKTALNTDLWERLLSLSEMHRLRFVWVKGHDGHEYNERCDREAVAQAEKFT